VPLTQWGVVAALDERDTLHGYHQSRNRALAAIVAVLLLVGVAAWRVSRGILVPIAAWRAPRAAWPPATTAGARPQSGPREMRDVAREFNRMVVATDESAQRLRASESHYRTLIQNLPVAVVSHLPDTSIEVFNHRACALLRMTHEQMQGRKALDRAWYFVDASGERLSPRAYPVSRVLQTHRPMPAEVMGIVSEGDRALRIPAPHTGEPPAQPPHLGDGHGLPAVRRPRRAAARHRGLRRRHDAAPQRGTARGQGKGRGGEQGQDGLPLAREPRAAHAAERHQRLLGAGAHRPVGT
jgi:PAS domain-containing protein